MILENSNNWREPLHDRGVEIFSALIRSNLSVYFLQANPILKGTVFKILSDPPFEKGGMPDSQLYF